MTSSTPTQCVIYARFSPRPGAELAVSNEAQVLECSTYAAKQGWVVASTHADAERSGNDHERPGVWQALSSLRRGSVLLVTHLDRLARDSHLAAILEREIENAGARLVSVHGEGTGSNSPEDELIRTILHAHNAYIRKVNGFRTSSLMRYHQNVLRRAVGAVPPLGYRVKAGNLVPHEEEQRALAVIREMRGKASPDAMARRLTELGVKPRGKAWRGASIRRTLSRLPKDAID